MLKKIVTVFLCIVCTAGTLIGCGKADINPESRCISNFVATADRSDMPIVVDEPKSEDVQNIYIAVKRSADESKILWQIEHYEMTDEEKAKVLFDNLIAEREKTFGETISITENGKLVIATLTIEETYFYLEKVGNILILAEIPVEYKPSITSFVKELENTLETES